ncbi:DUF5667 domain-containing protein [Jatrophihabitans fulvus]
MIEHRVRLRGRPRLRRYPDPAESPDPRVQSVLAQLEALREAPAAAPDRDFRAELRAQLVAVAPRIVAEGDPTPVRPRPMPHRAAVSPATSPAAATSAATREGPRRERVRITIGRPLAVVATMITVLGLVLAGAVWMSQKAVPGDALYGLKRASERFELSLADNDTERAQDHLDFARERVDEARRLAGRPSASGTGLSADGLSGETSGLIADALAAADGDTRTATKLLGTVAVDDGSGRALDPLVDWWPAQRTSLAALSKRLPSGTRAGAAAKRSLSILEKAKARAAALQERADCKCLKGARTDDFGPVPTSATAPRTTTPGRSTPTQRPTRSTPRRTTPGTKPGTTTGTTTGRPAPRTTPAAPSSTPSRKPGLQLPPILPSLLPQQPGAGGASPSQTCVINILGIKICR